MFLSLPTEFVLALLVNGLELLLLLSASTWVYLKVLQKARQVPLHKSLLTAVSPLALPPTLLSISLPPTAFHIGLEVSFFFQENRLSGKNYV